MTPPDCTLLRDVIARSDLGRERWLKAAATICDAMAEQAGRVADDTDDAVENLRALARCNAAAECARLIRAFAERGER